MSHGNALFFGGDGVRFLRLARVLWALVVVALAVGVAHGATPIGNISGSRGSVNGTWQSATLANGTYSTQVGNNEFAVIKVLYSTSNDGSSGIASNVVNYGGLSANRTNEPWSFGLPFYNGSWHSEGAIKLVVETWLWGQGGGDTFLGKQETDWVSVTAPPPKSWQTQLKYFNDKPYPVTVKVFKDGNPYHTETVGANELWAYTVQDTGPTKPVYTYIVGVDGLMMSNEQWQAAPTGTFHTAASGTVAPTKVAEAPSTTPPTDANTTTIPPATNLPSAMPTAPASQPVWRSPTGSGSGGSSTYTGPTDATFREGINNITSRQDKQQASLDKVAENTKKGADLHDATKKAVDENSTEAKKSAELTRAAADLAAQKTSLETSFGGLTEGRGTGTAPAPFSYNAPSVVVDLSFGSYLQGLSATQLNPAESNLMTNVIHKLIAWFRAFVGWTAVLGLVAYAGDGIRKAVADVLKAQTQGDFSFQSAMNSHPITAWASVPFRLAMLAVIGGVFIGMPAAIVQIFSTDWTILINEFAAAMNQAGGGDSGFGTVVGIANQYVPLATLIVVTGSYAGFEWVLLPVHILWMFLARFAKV